MYPQFKPLPMKYCSCSRMKELFSFFFAVAALVSPIFCLCLPYVSASSSPSVANIQPLKPKRLRNEATKSVQPNPNRSAEVFDPYIGLGEENLDVESKQQVLDMQMSIMLVEPMPSSRPTYNFELTFPPSSKPIPTPTQSPTIDDPNFGKVEGKARNSAATGGSQLVVPSLVFSVLLISGFWY